MARAPLQFTANSIEDFIPSVLRAMGVSSIARIKLRLSTTGRGVDTRKLRGARGRGRYSASYERFKRRQNKETSFVNLQLSGRMVANMQIIEQKRRSPKQSVTIGFTSAEENEKALENTERSGVWLGLTKKETSSIRTLGRKLMEKKVRQLGGRSVKIRIT